MAGIPCGAVAPGLRAGVLLAVILGCSPFDRRDSGVAAVIVAWITTEEDQGPVHRAGLDRPGSGSWPDPVGHGFYWCWLPAARLEMHAYQAAHWSAPSLFASRQFQRIESRRMPGSPPVNRPRSGLKI